MTVLSSESRLVGTVSTSLPRVNLLPPEIAEKAAFRKIQFGLGGAVVASLGVAALLYVSASHGVSTAQQGLDAAQAQNASLQHQVTAYASVKATYAEADAAQAQLTSAMGDEVRFSDLLNDISLSIPSGVWLTQMSLAQAAAATSATGVPTVGTLSVSGVAFDHDDVASWLESIATEKSFSDPYFSNSTESLLSGRKVVNFTGSSSVTSTALSGRYTKPIGG